jgi:amino acid adenylation domain-containing protein
MPHNSSMKLDRKRLRELADDLTQDQIAAYGLSSGEVVAPTTEAELRLREVWATILRIDVATIAKHDNFLQIGGDSISAIQLVAAAREHSIGLTVADIFANPQLNRMAVVATTWGQTTDSMDIAPLNLLPADERGRTLAAVREQCGITDGEEIEDVYPCSALQEGLMALAVKQPGSYIAKHIFRLPDHIDLARFRAAWEATVERCENLRTRIAAVDGRSVQAVIRNDISWGFGRSESTTTRDALAAAQSLKMQYGSQLARYETISESSGERYFLLAMHHAVFDAWGMQVVLHCLYSFYGGRVIPRHVPYAHFIKYTIDQNSDAARNFWKMQLDGATHASFPQSNKHGTKGDPGVRTLVKRFDMPRAQKSSITAATILRAAWAIILGEYCESDDVCFGTTVSGRQAPVNGLDGMPGATIATIPVRVRLDRQQVLRDYLDEVQKQANASIAYEQFGIQNMYKISKEAREVTNFSSLLVLQPVQHLVQPGDDQTALLLPGQIEHDTEIVEPQVVSTYPLLVDCNIYSDSVELVLEYQTDKVQEIQMVALSHHFEHVVGQLIHNDERTLGQIQLASDWDLEQVKSWNSPQPEARVGSVLELIAEQASSHPTREALVSSTTSITYSEMERMSTGLAFFLRETGMAPGTPVPICLEKSPWAIVAILGVMKAGGVYVPLDPAHPQDRLNTIVQEVNASFILVSEQTRKQCEEMVPRVVELSESFLHQLCKGHREGPALLYSLSANDMAYIIFTSGSTGKPKGITVNHGPLCTSITRHRQAYPVSESSRVLQFSNFVFDGSFEEIFMALTVGGAVCVPSDAERMGDIHSFMTANKVNIAMFTPTFARTLRPEQVPTLEMLVLGGEALTKANLETWFGHVQLVNGYGPTEVVISCAMHHFKSVDDEPSTIGRSFNGDCYIVDRRDHNRIAPIGCIGELVVHSSALAQGYLNDVEKTKAAFFSSTEWLSSSSTSLRRGFYKTGDLVRYDGNGNIEYIGRKDNQVKLRGLRIELAEVETAIQRALPMDCVVSVNVVRRNTRDSLVAFFSPTIPQAQDGVANSPAQTFYPMTRSLHQLLSQLKASLKSSLPAYMIPETYLPVQEMPYNSSMKLDRKQLLQLAQDLTREEAFTYALAEADKERPKTTMEFQLRDIWSSVLGLDAEEIGRNDSFLQIGGDSISAIQLVVAARHCNVALTVAQIFEHHQLKAMAVVVGSSGDADHETTAAPFATLPTQQRDTVKAEIVSQCSLASVRLIENAYTCTPLQSDYMELAVQFPQMYLAKSVFRLSPDLPTERFVSTWEAIVRTSPNLRTRIINVDGCHFQAILDEGAIWEESKSRSPEDMVRELAGQPMGFGDRLSRYALVHTKDGERFFVWIVRHAIYDGWTMSLLESNLEIILAGGEPSPGRDYAQFARSVAELDQTRNFQYWREALEGSQRPNFPLVPRGYIRSEQSAVATTKFATKTAALDMVTSSTVTKATILRAAWALLLAKYSETDDICFGVTVSGRQAHIPGLDEMMGTTISSVPVRIRIPDDKVSVSEFLLRVQNQASEMIPHEQFGLRQIGQSSVAAAEVVDLSSLLVIQSEQRQSYQQSLESSSSSNNPGFMSRADDQYPKETAMQGFLPFPLLVDCHIRGFEVELDMKYHEGVITPATAREFLAELDRLIQQLVLVDQRPLSEIWRGKLSNGHSG